MTERLAKPPYEEQAHRLFERLDDLREHLDGDDREWMDAVGEAMTRFLHTGELPDDELMREAALAHGEFVGLLAHACGEWDPDVMEVFDRAARKGGRRRAAAVRELQAMAVAGRLMSAGPIS